jgi:hypothetical protein
MSSPRATSRCASARARRAATRSRPIGERVTTETADAWIAAWKAKAAEDGLEWDRLDRQARIMAFGPCLHAHRHCRWTRVRARLDVARAVEEPRPPVGRTPPPGRRRRALLVS